MSQLPRNHGQAAWGTHQHFLRSKICAMTRISCTEFVFHCKHRLPGQHQLVELHLVQLWMVAFVLLWLISFTGIVFGWTPDVGLPALVLHTSRVVHLTGDRLLSFFFFFFIFTSFLSIFSSLAITDAMECPSLWVLSDLPRYS